jgi:hypothetical protein
LHFHTKQQAKLQFSISSSFTFLEGNCKTKDVATNDSKHFLTSVLMGVPFRLAQAGFEPNLYLYKYPEISSRLFFLLTPPMVMEQAKCSETSPHKIQKPGNHPTERIQVWTFNLLAPEFYI